MLMLKRLFFLLFVSTNIYAIDVLVSTNKIDYNEEITIQKLSSASVSSVKKFCIPLTIDDLEKNRFLAKHYIRKGLVLCRKNIKLYKKNSVVFNFGSIQIEREGKVVFENDEYIKIKRTDGKIEKIYKDGRLR